MASVAHLQPIDDDVDRVLLRLGERRQIVALDDRSVDAEAHEALGLHVVEELDELALAIPNHRREQQDLRVFRQRQRRVDHLRHALRLQRHLVVRTIRRADAREQQPQVIVDLGDGADGRARIVRGGSLLDRDRRRQAFDQVDVGLFHQLQELARVRRQRLNVAALAFGVERVECERGLAGPGQTGDHNEPLAWQVEIDAFQVVGAGSADADFIHRRGRLQEANLLL